MRERQMLCHFVEVWLANGTVQVLRAVRIALRRLERRQTSLNGNAQHGLRGQLEQTIVLQPEFQHQIGPACRIEQRLVRLDVRVDGERQQTHALPDLVHLIGLEGGERFARMHHGVQSPIGSNELDEFLDAQLELNGGADLAQLGLVVHAPGGALGRLPLLQVVLDVPRHLENVHIGQITDLGANRQSFGRLVVSETQQVFDNHPVESSLFPLVRRR